MAESAERNISLTGAFGRALKRAALAASIGVLGGGVTYGIAPHFSPDYQEKYPSLSVTDAEALKMDNVRKFSNLIGAFIFMGVMSGGPTTSRKNERPQP